MKVNQLRYFLSIVEAGSLSKAARNLGVAQPALSQHVTNLEQELDSPLLERSPRGVVCTPAGNLLYEHARTIVRQIERAEADVRHLGQSPRGEIVVVIAASIAQIVSAPLAQRVAAEFPEVTLQIQEDMSINLARRIDSGQADIALVPSGIMPAGVDAEPVLAEDLVFGGAKGQPGDDPGPIEFEAACRFPLILPTRPHHVRNTLEQAAFDRGIRLNVKAEQDSPRLLPPMVRAGYAYSMLPANALFDDRAMGGIFVRKVVKPDITRSLHIIWPKASSRDQLTAGVRNALRETIIEVSDAGHLHGALKINRSREA